MTFPTQEDLNRRMADESFLGRVFDSYQNMRQIAECLSEACRQRGIERPRLVELSRRPTGIQDFLPEADWERHPTHLDNEPNLGDPVRLPFADKSIDGCLMSDVYEHVPAESRPALLKEMLRITDGLVLVACPNGNQLVPRLDRLVFDFIWGKYGERFTPLAQHMKYGFEPIEEVLVTLKAQGADQVVVLPVNYVYRWIHMILIYFDLQHNNPGAEIFEPLNRIYNERLAPFDYREPCYRYLIAIPTNPEIQIDKLNEVVSKPSDTLPSASETDQMLTQAFREINSVAADEIRHLHSTIERTHEQIEALTAKVMELKTAQDELDRISSTMGWRLLSRYGRLKYRHLLGLYRLLGLSHQTKN